MATKNSRRNGLLTPAHRYDIAELLLKWSGCWESNPDYIHPMDAYYHYTTARSSGKKEGRWLRRQRTYRHKNFWFIIAKCLIKRKTADLLLVGGNG